MIKNPWRVPRISDATAQILENGKELARDRAKSSELTLLGYYTKYPVEAFFCLILCDVCKEIFPRLRGSLPPNVKLCPEHHYPPTTIIRKINALLKRHREEKI